MEFTWFLDTPRSVMIGIIILSKRLKRNTWYTGCHDEMVARYSREHSRRKSCKNWGKFSFSFRFSREIIHWDHDETVSSLCDRTGGPTRRAKLSKRSSMFFRSRWEREDHRKTGHFSWHKLWYRRFNHSYTGISWNGSIPKWMIKKIEHPTNKWMMTGGTPIYENPHIFSVTASLTPMMRSKNVSKLLMLDPLDRFCRFLVEHCAQIHDTYTNFALCSDTRCTVVYVYIYIHTYTLYIVYR